MTLAALLLLRKFNRKSHVVTTTTTKTWPKKNHSKTFINKYSQYNVCVRVFAKPNYSLNCAISTISNVQSMCEKYCEHRKSRDKRNTNKQMMAPTTRKTTRKKNRIKFNKQTHILNNVCEREQKKKYNRKTSKHRRISVDICHFFFCASLLLLLLRRRSDHFVYMKKKRYKRIKEMVYSIHCFTHTITSSATTENTTWIERMEWEKTANRSGFECIETRARTNV